MRGFILPLFLVIGLCGWLDSDEYLIELNLSESQRQEAADRRELLKEFQDFNQLEEQREYQDSVEQTMDLLDWDNVYGR